MVPVRPGGMGLVQAFRAGLLTGGEPVEYISRLGHLQLKQHSTTSPGYMQTDSFPHSLLL